MNIVYRSMIDISKYVLVLIIIVLLSNTLSTKLTELSNIPSISDNPTNEELARMLAYSRQAESLYIDLGYALMMYIALLYLIFIIADFGVMRVSGYTIDRKRVATVCGGTILVGATAILTMYNIWFLLLLCIFYTGYHAALYHRRTWHFLKQSDFWYAYGLYTLLTVLPIILVWYGADGALFWITLLLTMAVVYGRAYFRGLLLHETVA